METPEKRWGPLWPFVLGTGIGAAGMLFGFTVPVGAYCDAAFFPDQETPRMKDLVGAFTNAISEDMHQAYNKLPETDYESVCKASAGQWSALCWAVIALGIVVFCLGFVLWSRARRHTAILEAAHGFPTARAQGVSAELAQLAHLRDQGVVTEIEFEQQKAKLLDG